MNLTEKQKVYFELFVWSFISLFLELFAIRWLSADIRAFTVFKTFPLVACYIGFGLGYARKDPSAYQFLPIALLLFCLCMKLADVVGFCMWGFPSISIFQWQTLVLSGNSIQALSIFMIFLSVLLAGPLLACMYIGTKIGYLFEKSAPLEAYAINLLGAGVGSVAFTFVAFLGASPAMLFTLPCIVLLAYLLRERKFLPAIVLAVAFFIVWAPEQSKGRALAPDIQEKMQTDASVLWSPYQRIDLTRFLLKKEKAESKVVGIELGVNRAFYQYYLDESTDPTLLPPTLAKLLADRTTEYSVPFQLKKDTKSVLVVGAGTGQHVSTGLKLGANDIDAVEIDPIILKLGEIYNPGYSSPYVHKICDDARHYFNTCNKKYDLIIFSVLDSHTVTGQGSSVRLDSYVYTQQSFENAAKLLKPDGVMYLSYASFRRQIERRLFETMKAANIGEVHSLKFRGVNTQNSNLAVGKPLDSNILPPGWERIQPPDVTVARPVLTDDWPYLYVDPSVVDYPYLFVVALIFIFSVFLARKTVLAPKTEPLYWQMFFLGAAFLLLELTSIARLALLFGSTWITSAVVINCVLVMLFIANLFAMRFKQKLNTHILYGCLFVLIIVSYLLPTNKLSELTAGFGPTAPFIVALITLSPMCAAGLIFPQAFAKSASPSKGLTFNILGAVLGGLLEYTSYFCGNSSLVLLSGGLYLISYLCFMREPKMKQLDVVSPPID